MQNSLRMRFNCIALCPHWNSILLCFLQDSAVHALLQRTYLIRPSVWTMGGVWTEIASHSVKLWRACSRVLAMVTWASDKANTVGILQVCFEETCPFFTLPVCHFQRRTTLVRCAARIRALCALLILMTRVTPSFCGKANPALWAFVMERWVFTTYTYLHFYSCKTFIEAVD